MEALADTTWFSRSSRRARPAVSSGDESSPPVKRQRRFAALLLESAAAPLSQEDRRPAPREARLPGLPRRILDAQAQVMASLGAPPRRRRLLLPRRGPDQRNVTPEALIEACKQWRLTLRQLEALLLPSWNFTCSFQCRSDFLEYVNARACSPSPLVSPTSSESEAVAEHATGEAPQAAVALTKAALVAPRALLGTICGTEFAGPDGLVCYSARWAELLGGAVLARLMTDGQPTAAGGGVDPHWAAEALASLRHVVWAPKRHWAFPRRVRDRLLFISWVGRSLGLNPSWNLAVLPCLSMDL